MKKLMIATTAMLLGIAANAGQANWGASEIYQYAPPSGFPYGDGYAVYLVNAATYAYDSAAADIAKGDIGFLTATGTKTDVQYVGAGTLGEGAAGGLTGDIFNTGAVSAYAVILDSATIAGAKHVYLLEEHFDSIGGQGQFATFTWDENETYVPGAWSAVAVPEPTSGLLLLLGVAGLALRRRRA